MTKDKQRDHKPGIYLSSDEALLDLSDTILNPEEGVAVDDPLVKIENQNEISNRIIQDVPLSKSMLFVEKENYPDFASLYRRVPPWLRTILSRPG